MKNKRIDLFFRSDKKKDICDDENNSNSISSLQVS